MGLQHFLRTAYKHSAFLRWGWFLVQYLRAFIRPELLLSARHRRFRAWQALAVSRRFNERPYLRQAPATDWPDVDLVVLPGPCPLQTTVIQALNALDFPSDHLHIKLPAQAERPDKILHGLSFASISVLAPTSGSDQSRFDASFLDGNSEWLFVLPFGYVPAATALQRSLTAALSDPLTACWSLNCTTHGHFFYYDPVTLETASPPLSILLLKRSALREMLALPNTLSQPASPQALVQNLHSMGCTLRHLPWANCTHLVSDSTDDPPSGIPQKVVNVSFPEADPPGQTPLVSVIMRTYAGRGALLRQAMQTVFHQNYPNIELLVVQDGGDCLAPMVQNLAQKEKHVRVRFLPQPPVGRSAAGNLGLQSATGQILMFLDDDDLLFSDHIQTLAQALLQNPQLGACYSQAVEVFTSYDAGQQHYTELAYRTFPGQPPAWNYETLLSRNFIPIQSILFRQHLYAECGGFDLKLDHMEDWNLWLRYGQKCVFLFIPRTTSLFRTPASFRIRAQRQAQLVAAQTMAKSRLT